MSFYANLEATTRRLLTQFGIAMTIKRTSSLNVVTTITVRGVFVKRERHSIDGQNGNVEIGDWRILVSAKDSAGVATSVREGDRISDGSESFSVVHIEAIKPGGEVLGIYVWARQG